MELTEFVLVILSGAIVALISIYLTEIMLRRKLIKALYHEIDNNRKIAENYSHWEEDFPVSPLDTVCYQNILINQINLPPDVDDKLRRTYGLIKNYNHAINLELELVGDRRDLFFATLSKLNESIIKNLDILKTDFKNIEKKRTYCFRGHVKTKNIRL